MPPRTLVIGTTGQLAIELHRQSEAAAVAVLPPRKVDITNARDLDDLLNHTQPQVVLNAAAYTAVDRAEHERERAFAVNADGPRRLARWCETHGASLVHFSTDYVFDGSKAAPYVEDDPVGPLNVYGHSKLAGEIAVREELERHLILRTSWVFSAHGNNFVKTMRRLARERDEVRVVADQRGRPTSAADLAAAALRLLQEHGRTPANTAWGTYHLANAGVTTWHAFAQAIVDQDAPVGGRRPMIAPIPSSAYPTPATRPANSELATARFEGTFGFGLRPFGEALADVIRDLQAGEAPQLEK